MAMEVALFGESEMLMIVKLIVAAMLGAAIGFEREVEKRPGSRTHALVCMGATLFTIVSFATIGDNIDGSRIASGIVTGIGFLAAGTIIKVNDRILGLTTAAELWVLAAIGIAVGLGMFLTAFGTAVVVLIVLGPLKFFDSRLLRKTYFSGKGFLIYASKSTKKRKKKRSIFNSFS
jgi:putative Mg2+ transporter-C (MgtC) family protein